MKAKYYEALAKAIKHNSTQLIFDTEGQIALEAYYPIIEHNPFVGALCDILSEENPKFNKEKFLEACK